MSKLPRIYTPQLATLVKTPPEGPEWLHEMKYDGYRIGCRIGGDEVTLLSRNGKDWTGSFPTVAEAARRLRVRQALLDGEVAMLLPDGRTSFQALQNASAGESGGTLVYFVFDLLHLDGEDLTGEPLDVRKARLARLRGIGARGRIRLSEHIEGRGRDVFAQACGLGAEGIISKRRDAAYRPGRRGEWVKTKCIKRQEFVVGGFTDPEGSRKGIGSLLVGYYDDGKLLFAGKVGTGFTHKSALDLRRALERIERATSPFSPPPPGWLGRNAHWVTPSLVAEVAFAEWTGDGKIRHPSFQGLRRDKAPREIAREREINVPPAVAPPAPPPNSPATIAGVRLTHPDRLIFDAARVTKAGLAAYYEEIADWILPHLEGRPLTLVRCPEGVSGECFYMKHSKVWAPSHVRRVRIPEKKKIGEYLVVDNLPALIGLVQMGIVEIHTWNSRIDRVERPDRLVFDIDPGPEVTWAAVIDATRRVRTVLEALDLQSFVKNTGSRGLHVVVPLRPERDWSDCLDFSRAIAEQIAGSDAARFTTKFAKAGRERKILIDYLRNNRTNTSVAAFSTRRKPHAPVSTTLTWEELDRAVPADHFTVLTVPARLAATRPDPWREYWTSRQRLSARAFKATVGRST